MTLLHTLRLSRGLRLASFWMLVSAVGLAACSAPNSKTEHYTLLAAQDAASSAASGYSASVGVSPVRLPEMLKHSGIVSHGAEQRVHVAAYQVWAGDLQEAVTRVVASDLSVHLQSDQVWPYPWNSRARPSQQISLVLERFSGELGGTVALRGKWRLLTGDARQELHAARVSLQTEAEDDSYGAYVAALNTLLNQVAAQIANTLLEHQLDTAAEGR